MKQRFVVKPQQNVNSSTRIQASVDGRHVTQLHIDVLYDDDASYLSAEKAEAILSDAGYDVVGADQEDVTEAYIDQGYLG